MAPRITREERASADTPHAEFLPYDEQLQYDADTEAAIEDLKASTATAEQKATLWLYRVPTDDEGEMVQNAKPSLLFTAPIDRYTHEEISTRLMNVYMKPG